MSELPEPTWSKTLKPGDVIVRIVYPQMVSAVYENQIFVYTQYDDEGKETCWGYRELERDFHKPNGNSLRSETRKSDSHEAIRDENWQLVIPRREEMDYLVELSEPAVPKSDPINPPHYTCLKPEPIEVIEAWGLNAHEAQILKYLSRWRRKGGIEDLQKCRWWIDRLIGHFLVQENRTIPENRSKLGESSLW